MFPLISPKDRRMTAVHRSRPGGELTKIDVESCVSNTKHPFDKVTPRSMFEQAFKNIDDALRNEAGCTTELDYTEQTSWLLFLKYLDGLEQDKATEAQLEGKKHSFILDAPYRWERWAAPKGPDGAGWIQTDGERAGPSAFSSRFHGVR